MIDFWRVRLGVLAVVLLFNIIVLGLAASFITTFNSDVQPIFRGTSQPAWAGLAVATTVFTLLGIVPMLVIDFVRRGATFSWILVESIILGILSIFWLATAADATGNSLNGVVGLPGGCGAFSSAARVLNGPAGTVSALNDAASICRQQQAVEAFSFINWILLMGYTMALVIFTFAARSRGNDNIWKSSVRDTDFLYKGPASYLSRNNVPMQNTGYASHPSGAVS